MKFVFQASIGLLILVNILSDVLQIVFAGLLAHYMNVNNLFLILICLIMVGTSLFKLCRERIPFEGLAGYFVLSFIGSRLGYDAIWEYRYFAIPFFSLRAILGLWIALRLKTRNPLNENI